MGRPCSSRLIGLLIRKEAIMPIPVGMICRPYITVDGQKIWAKDYGKKAFCFFPSLKKGKKKKPEAVKLQA